MNTITTTDSLGTDIRLDLKDLKIVNILPVIGGKLLIKELDENPIDCTWDECTELAEVVVIALDGNDGTQICYHCKEHHEAILKNVLDKLPFFITH